MKGYVYKHKYYTQYTKAQVMMKLGASIFIIEILSFSWSIMCMWTTDVRGNKDAYPIASVISCNAGCTPLPYDGPGPQADPPTHLEGKQRNIR